jgi:hypothetical protein
MKKTFPAVIAALLITVCLAGGMFAVGGGSLLNTANAAPAATQVTDSQAMQTVQAQAALIAQYQAREVQYQAQINEAVSRITAANQQMGLANQQIGQYQNLLTSLQNSGVITVGSDGTITINPQQPQGFNLFGGGEHNDHDGGG